MNDERKMELQAIRDYVNDRVETVRNAIPDIHAHNEVQPTPLVEALQPLVTNQGALQQAIGDLRLTVDGLIELASQREPLPTPVVNYTAPELPVQFNNKAPDMPIVVNLDPLAAILKPLVENQFSILASVDSLRVSMSQLVEVLNVRPEPLPPPVVNYQAPDNKALTNAIVEMKEAVANSVQRTNSLLALLENMAKRKPTSFKIVHDDGTTSKVEEA